MSTRRDRTCIGGIYVRGGTYDFAMKQRVAKWYEELKASLINDNKGLSFKVKSVEGKYRFLKIDKLNEEVKSVKMIRKKGRDQVVLKLRKKEERKWWSLKAGSGSSYGGFDDEEYGNWSDDESIDLAEDKMEQDNAAADEKAQDKTEGEEEKKEEDVAMEEVSA